MPCDINKIDSNISGLSFAEEVCLKQLPTTAVDGFEPTWYGLEPNSYSDFGGELTTVTRSPIDPSRQNKKGVPVDIAASGGINTDFTRDKNFQRLLQGFFFADYREKPSTRPFNAALIGVTGVTAADDKYATGASAAAFNVAGLLVLASGFAQAGNNGLKLVVSADANDITVDNTFGGLTNEGAAANQTIEAVGYQFATADAAIDITGGVVSMTSTAAVFLTLGLTIGEWIFIGGDTLADNRFANNVGFARIKSIAAGTLVFDDVTWAAADEASAGKEIQIFFGRVLRNEKLSALIKRRSYQFERTLGLGPTAVQAEYLEGAVSNELTLNIPGNEKATIDIGYVACDNTYRSGEVGDEIKSLAVGATVIPAEGADAINTSSNVYRLKMNIVDPLDNLPDALFAYVTEANISINNNVTPDKAIGILGALDTSAGNFVVSGDLTAYFSTVEAVRAVRNNADVGLNMIFASDNTGFVWDIPLLGLGGGRLAVEKDQSIKVPLTPNGAENANGYTLLYVMFPYLPTVAMPV